MTAALGRDVRRDDAGVRPLLELTNVSVDYRTTRFRPPYRALDGVSAAINKGGTLAVVGESGSGKTTIAKAILGLVPLASGSIVFDGDLISDESHKHRRRLASDLQIVYQDPYRSLSPTRTVLQTLAEPLLAQRACSRVELRTRAEEMVSQVGLPPGSSSRYPGELSGGERQRVAIARALMLSPRLVLCDEPVSALDISIQGQILNLLMSLQERLSLSYLFISHNMAVVRYFSERVLVLYMAQVMEVGMTKDVCESPIHPYTRALIEAVPDLDPEVQQARRARRRSLARDVDVSPPVPTGGCVFAPRCSYALQVCREVVPALTFVGTSSRQVACHRSGELTRHHSQRDPAVSDQAVPNKGSAI